jgi:hypothetical protein
VRRRARARSRVGVSTEWVFTRVDLADGEFPTRSLAMEPQTEPQTESQTEPQTEPQRDSRTAGGSDCMPVRADASERATEQQLAPWWQDKRRRADSGADARAARPSSKTSARGSSISSM